MKHKHASINQCKRTCRPMAPARARARKTKNSRWATNRRHPADSLVDAKAETAFQMDAYLSQRNERRREEVRSCRRVSG